MKMRRVHSGTYTRCSRWGKPRMIAAHPVKTRAVRYISEPEKRYRTRSSAVIADGSNKIMLTMILVIATKARMNVMYAFVRLNWSSREKVFTASPPPRIATRRIP